MALACASRFAVLKLEDDDISDSSDKKPISGNQNNQAGKNKMPSKTGSNDTKSKPKKKKKPSTEIAELQSLAFGTHKSKHKSSSNNAKLVNASQKQWEEWKLKDSEFVSETYEQDLQEALLLSKIDYEEKKEVYDAIQKETEQSKNANSSKKKKKGNQKKEKGTMSLDQFQNMNANSAATQQKMAELDDFDPSPRVVVVEEESNFFDKIEEDAEKIITKEHKQEQYKGLDPVQESARLLQYQEEIRKKDEEIIKLKEAFTKLKDELKNVKSRNRKLYQILESGEMREKAEILVQIDHLTGIKDELNEQLSEYHTQLEQERSKVHSLQTELKKYQNNKKMRTESK